MTTATMMPPARSWMTETLSHHCMRVGPGHKCCSASQANTASISASVLSVNRWPSLLGGRWFGTSTYFDGRHERSLGTCGTEQHVRLEWQRDSVGLVAQDQNRTRDTGDPKGSVGRASLLVAISQEVHAPLRSFLPLRLKSLSPRVSRTRWAASDLPQFQMYG